MNAATIRKHIPSPSLCQPELAFAVVLACCLCLNLQPALAAPGSWTRKANMPVALDTHASCAVDGILYVIGGHKDVRVYTQLNTLFAYDPKTDSWRTNTGMPTARRWPAACVVDGIIYVIGGGGMFSPATDAVEAYDPKTDTWMTKAKLSSPRFALVACAVDGIIYAIGGATGALPDIQGWATVQAYDPKTDQWTPRRSLPIAGGGGVANVVSGLIYVFLGKDSFAYDPKTDRWTPKARIPTWSLESYFAASGTVDGIIYLFGGSSYYGDTTYDLTLAYDPDPNPGKFTAKRKMPMTCEAAACATIDGKIYHTGGANQDPIKHPDGAIYYDSLWVFDPQGGVAPQILSLNLESTNSVRLGWQGEAGRLYGVESTLNLVKPLWIRWPFSSGTNAILATNEVVEATAIVPLANTQRFFRVLEAN